MGCMKMQHKPEGFPRTDESTSCISKITSIQQDSRDHLVNLHDRHHQPKTPYSNMTCSFLERSQLIGCLASSSATHYSDMTSFKQENNYEAEADQEGVEIIRAEAASSPQSPVSVMADLSSSLLLVDKNNSYKEVIDYYYSPSQQAWNNDPYHRDRVRSFRNNERLQTLSLESIFDQHADDEDENDVDMEWSDDEDDEPRGIHFIIDDCSSVNISSTLHCNSIAWNAVQAALKDENEGKL
ncbi:hypothetical protein MPSEU_000038600 [Mayamaea pseudoterrestris]|nr:hypothetical protein MPSEU_000038600 [Mayamaea pseudoterrestris]